MQVLVMVLMLMRLAPMPPLHLLAMRLPLTQLWLLVLVTRTGMFQLLLLLPLLLLPSVQLVAMLLLLLRRRRPLVQLVGRLRLLLLPLTPVQGRRHGRRIAAPCHQCHHCTWLPHLCMWVCLHTSLYQKQHLHTCMHTGRRAHLKYIS